jgi:outer membrane protein TolC
MTLSLAQCLQLACARQPALAAQRASLAAAEDGYRALETLHVPTFLARDLPVRRQQAALGITAAAAAVEHAERETIYAVTRTYFTVIYAREQERVAHGIVERLSAIHDTAAQRLQAGARDVTSTDVDRASVYLELAQTQRLEAEEGMERGLAALREAIGLDPVCCVQVHPGPLPEPEVRLCQSDVVAWALARRADLAQADTFADVTGLEVEAQAARLLLRIGTFAAGADIHARSVPQQMHTSSEYRPGTEPPEMPSLLVGNRTERMQRASSLHDRAAAQVEKARNLIALEAQNAFRRWEAAARKLPHARQAASAGDRLAEELRKDFTAGLKVRPEEVINMQVLASQARAQHNEVVYQLILALAELERVTAGAFCAGLAGPIPPAAQPSPVNGMPRMTTGAW